MSRLALALVLVAAAAGSAFADDPGGKPVPKDPLVVKPGLVKPGLGRPVAKPAASATPAELAVLEPLARGFKCSSSKPVGVAYTTTLSGTWMLNNRWLRLDYARIAGRDRHISHASQAVIGWDSAARKLVLNGVDDRGCSYTAYSSGGSPLVFEGDFIAEGTKKPVRFTFTATPDKKLIITGDVGGEQAFDETCR